MTYEEFCTKHGIKIARATEGRRTESDLSNWNQECNHFWILLTFEDTRTIWAGNYSVGTAHAETWAKAHKKALPWDIRQRMNESPLGKVPGAIEAFHDIYQRAVYKNPGAVLSVSDILNSLALDSESADQHFEDWADDYGYDTDSIKARVMWDACNKIRRGLLKTLGQNLYDQLMECEE